MLSQKRERKILKRRRKNVFHASEKQNSIQKFRIKYETKLISNFKSNLFTFLIENKFITGSEDIKENP